MKTPADIDAIGARHICADCVRESYLHYYINTHGVANTCHYCKASVNCITVAELSDRVDVAFEQHFYRTSEDPDAYQSMMLADKESTYDWERDGVPVSDAIMEAARVDDAVADDIVEILAYRHYDFEDAKMSLESPFEVDSHYEEKGPDGARWHQKWRNFESSMKTEARYFSRTASTVLQSVFAGIERMKSRDGRPLVIDAGPDTALTELYRARTFQADEPLLDALKRPDLHLGPPPSNYAAAGRMNARGISVFYGANDPLVALAEVRPPVGSRVAVARFEIARPIRLLDLTALGAVTNRGSLFDPDFADLVERSTFLQSLSRRITIPVMPDDEAFEYLPTQAIADFLATENETSIDGIVYPSVQAATGKLNVVLFHKAARVQQLAIPPGTEINGWLGHSGEDGWEVDYSVSEQVPPDNQKKEPLPTDFDPFFGDLRVAMIDDDSGREVTLRVDPESLRVHSVQAVSFSTNDESVSRRRWEKQDPEPF